MIRQRMQSLAREGERRGKLAAAAALARGAPQARAIASERAWLLGGAVGASYGDNAAALHRYLREHHPDVNAYWVINRDSPDVEKARAIGPVLYREDVWTYVRALLAEVHVISHGVHDVPGCASRLSSRAFKVRLGHGLTALKKTRAAAFRTIEGANAVFDLVPVSSEFERANKRTWGIDDARLVVTGVPRFDDLVRKARAAGARERRILYMPTWRDWVPRSEAGLSRSGFLRGVIAFLRHPRLREELRRRDAYLDVGVHPLMHHHLHALQREIGGADDARVRVLGRDVDIQDAIASARALVTDYSSVTWDFLYLDRPVLFYPFDVDEYERHRGAYFDLRSDLPGPSAHDADGAVAIVSRCLDEDFALPSDSPARRWQQRVFPFRDDRNCERVAREIFRRVGRRWPQHEGPPMRAAG